MLAPETGGGGRATLLFNTGIVENSEGNRRSRGIQTKAGFAPCSPCPCCAGDGRITSFPVTVWRRDMPLLDHFHPPLEDEYPWDSLHSGWATRLADLLNERWLPPQF